MTEPSPASEPLDDAAASSTATAEAGGQGESSWRGIAMLVLRWIMWLAVLAGIGWAVYTANEKLSEKKVDWRDIHVGWFAVSGALYLLGTLPCALFWRWILQAFGQSPGQISSIRAYFIGHLGKYLPGKAFVVVLRAGLLECDGVDPTVAAIAVFIETLTMMATGALLGAIVLLVYHSDQWLYVVIAIGMLAGAGLPTIPAVFRRVVQFAQVARVKEDIDEKLAGLDAMTLLAGWGANVIGYALLGLSLWATLKALPPSLIVGDASEALSNPWLPLPLLSGAVGLAIVAGFVSFLPGGAGARELVLSLLLTPLVGEAAALLSAVAMRMSWLLAEVVAAIILYYVPVGGEASQESESAKTT